MPTHQSVCLHVSAQLPLDQFFTCDLETSKQICQETPNLIKISQKKSCTLHVDLSVLSIAGNDIHVCSATQKMHVCASMAKWQRFKYLLHCCLQNTYNKTKGTHCHVSIATIVIQTHHNVHWLSCFLQTDQLQLNNSKCVISH
jgi:hypothetical protein